MNGSNTLRFTVHPKRIDVEERRERAKRIMRALGEIREAMTEIDDIELPRYEASNEKRHW